MPRAASSSICWPASDHTHLQSQTQNKSTTVNNEYRNQCTVIVQIYHTAQITIYLTMDNTKSSKFWVDFLQDRAELQSYEILTPKVVSCTLCSGPSGSECSRYDTWTDSPECGGGQRPHTAASPRSLPWWCLETRPVENKRIGLMLHCTAEYCQLYNHRGLSIQNSPNKEKKNIYEKPKYMNSCIV